MPHVWLHLHDSFGHTGNLEACALLQLPLELEHKNMNPYDCFEVERWELDKLKVLAARLSKETRMTGDEMRDAAQFLSSVVKRATLVQE